MNTKRAFQYNNAVSTVVSTILVVMIVISTVGAVLGWGMPFINQIQARTLHENVFHQFSVIEDSVQDMIYKESGAARKYQVNSEGGSVSISDSSDRFIMMYSLDEKYDFTVEDLNNSDLSFNVSLDSQSLYPLQEITDIDAYWFLDPILNIPVYENRMYRDFEGSYCSVLAFDLSSLKSIQLEEDIELLSIKLRLFYPKGGIGLNWNNDVELSLISRSERTYIPQLFQRFQYINSPYKLNSYFVVRSDYIECDISSLFYNIDFKSPYVEIMVEDPDYKLKNYHEIINSDGLLCFGQESDFVSFHSLESSSQLRPQLVIHYLEGLTSQKAEIVPQLDIVEDKIEPVDEDCGCTDVNEQSLAEETVLSFSTDEYSASFSDVSTNSDDSILKLSKGNYYISYIPENNLCYIQNGNEQYEEIISSIQQSTVNILKNKFSYDNLYGPDIHLEYECLPFYVKEKLIIMNKNALPAPSFEDALLSFTTKLTASNSVSEEPMGVCINGDILQLNQEIITDDKVFLTDSSGNKLFTLPEVFVWDSAGACQSRIKLDRQITYEDADIISMSILIPWNWLSDTLRTYPVTIDPPWFPSRIYDDTDILAWAAINGSWTQATGPFPPEHENYSSYTSGIYGEKINIAENDCKQNNWTTVYGNQYYTNLLFSVTVSEEIDEISDIYVDWVGYTKYDWNAAGTDEDIFLYIWNFDNSSWEIKAAETACITNWCRCGSIPCDSSCNSGWDDLFFKISDSSADLTDYIKNKQIYVGLATKIPPCFLGGTSIKLADGSQKNIEEINVGDQTLSYDEHNNKQVIGTVSHIFQHEKEQALPYYLLINNHLAVTPNHLIYVNDKWIHALDIKIGDLLTSADGSNVIVTTIDQIDKQVKTYSIEIEEYHNYYADDILVHNKVEDRYLQEDYMFIGLGKDLSPPVTSITANPDCTNPGTTINSTTIPIAWTGNDGGGTPEDDLVYSYRLLGYMPVWSAWTSEKIKVYYDLPDGSYTFEIRARDIVGNIGNSKSCSFIVIEDFTSSRNDVIPDAINGNDYEFTLSGPGTYPLEGTIRIDLFDNSLLFGRIYIFDTGIIKYDIDSSSGSYKNIMENGALLSLSPEYPLGQLRKPPPIAFEDNMFSLRFKQVIQSGDISSINGDFKLSISLKENYVREMQTETYNLKLQLWGPYNELWKNYLISSYGFSKTNNDLEPPYTTNLGVQDPISLMMTQSLCTTEIGLS